MKKINYICKKHIERLGDLYSYYNRGKENKKDRIYFNNFYKTK